MPKLDLPKIDYMPSLIQAFEEGFTLTTSDNPKLTLEIEQIKNDPDQFLKDYLYPETHFILPDGRKVERIPQTNLWYVEGNEFIGRISIRHYLDEGLLNHGGHLAYSIRQSHQNQGHATEMVRKSFEFCKKDLNLDKILVVIDKDNLPSIKLTEKLGGVLEDTRICPYDKVEINRYWITL